MKIFRWILVLFFICLMVKLHSYHYGKNKVQRGKTEWTLIESKHFDIYFTKGHDEFGKLTVLMAENAYYHLNGFFLQPIQNRIPIIIYSSKHDFQVTNIIYPLLSEGIGGFTETYRNRIAIPFDGSYKKFEQVLIHEITHAYINDIDGIIFKNPIFNSFNQNLPFWFSEGLPEYLAVGGRDIYNNMFIYDMIINDRLYDMEYLGGFFAYRLGESILVWISQTWDEKKVTEYFYNLRIMSDMNEATKKTFGFDFIELQKRFKLYLKREFPHILQEFQAPFELPSIKHTNPTKTIEQQNIFPRISPDGNSFIYYTSNKGRIVIRKNSFSDSKKSEIILTGQKTAKFEDFHFQRNNLSWFPDNRTIAFVSKTTFNDVIYFYDTKRKRITDRLSFLDFDSIYEIDISPNGDLLAFIAQKANRANLYIYDISKKVLKQVTDDVYHVASPNWSKDGNKIAFVCERFVNECNNEEGNKVQNCKISANIVETPNIFEKLIKDIYYFDINNETIRRLTNNTHNAFYPVWVDNLNIMFISEESDISNIFTINIVDHSKAMVTNILTGIHSFDYNLTNESLIYSTYFDNIWDIYQIKKELTTLKYSRFNTDIPVNFINDFHETFNTYEFIYHGKVSTQKNNNQQEVTRPINKNNPNQTNDSIESIHPSRRRLVQGTGQDSLKVNFFNNLSKNFRITQRPDSTNYFPPIVKKYKPKFQIDSFWGGLAYSSTWGTVGMLQLGLSDMLGNHGIGINMAFNGTLEESNLVVSYMYLPHRIDYGIAAFNFTDYTYYRLNPPIQDRQYLYDYLEYTQYETGLYLLTRFPISRFLRFDLEQQLYNYRTEWALYDSYYDKKEKKFDRFPNFPYRLMNEEDFIMYVPKVGYVFDNALYGSTGPLTGFKLTTFIKRSVSPNNKRDFTTLYNDYRAYLMLTPRFAIAQRLVFGASEGTHPELFSLTGFNGVRGYNDKYNQGNRKVLGIIEFRYPFIDYLSVPFPLPMQLGNIRGSIFADIGSVWDDDTYRGSKNGRLEDIKLGYGFGPRANLGFLILKLDIAWCSDFIKNSKPSYFLTLNEDF